MPRNKDFSRRIEIIDECLRRRQKKWFVEDLLETVNSKLDERFDKKVSKRTLYEDLKYLQEEKGAPIIKQWEGQRVYYKYDDATYSVLNLPISEEEITRLKDAIKMLREINDFSILEEVDLIVEKLEHTISTNVPDSRTMIQFEKHTYAEGAEFIDDLFESIKGKSVLKIAYQPFGASEPQEWIVHPYLLKEYRNRWFIICRKEGTDQVSNLALDRIRKIKNSGIQFRENNLFDPETYYDNLIGVSFPAGEAVQEVVLRITGSQVNYIKTKPIHKTQELISEENANSIVIKLRLVINYELQAVLLSYTPDIEVLQPVSLRQQMREKLTSILKLLE